MLIHQVLQELHIKNQCDRLGVNLWSCPQFIFLIMGLVIIGTVLLSYNIGQRYIDVQIVAVIVLLVAAFLLIIATIIIRAFERVVESKRVEAEHAAEILKLKDEFVFLATHELRTPTNAIKWGLESLRDEQPEAVTKGKELFDILERNTERLLSLVKDLLEVSRIESGTIQITPKPVSIVDVFTQAHKGIYPEAHKKKVAITFRRSSKVPLVYADDTRLKEAVEKVLINAVKYSKDGSQVQVEVEVTGKEVILHIQDKGEGLNEEELLHVFDKFRKANDQKDTDDTGLGLFIAKQLMEHMGGKIRVVSKKGEGSTFSLVFGRSDV